ncbi:uncharacterized protein LOC119568682 [Penaeus monodon]|uniref:uncharacterized protein LOC119568682 n=1 Tax=Penaeus monodon TaxID=6687 RepID=UPI0018A6EAAA|nr:uncharacterized protein LOC119568682 [Penaeus monodon]
MRCVDGYTAKCMTVEQRASLEEHLKGARATLAFLCDDPVFQKDYLSHGQCIIDVRDDWDKCHNHFKYLVNREHTRVNITQTKRDHNICCIRAGFLSCVYGISYLKCGKSEAIFLKKVTETLSYSDVHQEKCRKVSLRTCSSGKSSSGVGGLVALGKSSHYTSLIIVKVSYFIIEDIDFKNIFLSSKIVTLLIFQQCCLRMVHISFHYMCDR